MTSVLCNKVREMGWPDYDEKGLEFSEIGKMLVGSKQKNKCAECVYYTNYSPYLLVCVWNSHGQGRYNDSGEGGDGWLIC